MYTKLSHLTDKELSTFTTNKETTTQLEIELTQRVCALLDQLDDAQAPNHEPEVA